MEKTGISVTLTNRVREVEEKKHLFQGFGIAALGGIYLAMGLCGILFVLTDTMGVKASIELSVGMILAVSAAVTILLGNKQWKYAGVLLLLLGTAGYLLVELEPILLGLAYIKECIGARFDQYFLEIPLGNADNLVNGGQLFVALLFLTLLLADIMGVAVFFGNLRVIPVILFAIVDALCLISGLMPSVRAAVLQIVSLLGIGIKSACSNRQPMFSVATRVRSASRLRGHLQLQMTGLLLLLAAAVIWLSSSVLLTPAYQKAQEVRTQAGEIRQQIQEFALEDWNKWNLSPFKRGNMGINGGKLGDYRSVSAKNQVDLELIPDVDYAQTVFIKGFAAGLYAGNRWEQIALEDWANSYYDGSGNWSVVSDDSYMAPEYVKLATVKKRGPFIYDKIILSNAMRVKLVNAQSKYSYLPGFVLGSHFGDTLPVYGWAEGIGRSASYVTILTNPVKLLSATLLTDRIDENVTSFRLTDGTQTVEVDYGQFVRDNYLQIPQGVLDEVRKDWEAWRSVQPSIASNPTYLTVAREVANYLAEHAEYTLNPGKTPSDRDFIEYFMKEQKAGYCVHFASAGTMLFRMCGIPARYVEGYTATHLREGVTKEIEDSKAHAWVEIYVNGIGWVPVDVTPGSSGTEELLAAYDPESTETEPEGTDTGEETIEVSEVEVSTEAEESIGESGTETEPALEGTEVITETRPVSQNGTGDPADSQSEGSGTIPGGSGRLGTELLQGVLRILLGILLFFVLRYLLRKRSAYLTGYRSAQMNQERCRRAILCAFRYTEKLSRLCGRPVRIDIEPQKLREWYPDITEEQFAAWKAVIEETYFSSHAMTQEDRRTVIGFYQAVYEETLRVRGKDGEDWVFAGRVKQFLRKWISCYPAMKDSEA